VFSQTENSMHLFSIKKLNNSIRLNYILVDIPTDKVTYDYASKMSLVDNNYQLNNDFTLNIRGSQMIPPFGNVNSSNINIGLTYGLSILNAK